MNPELVALLGVILGGGGVSAFVAARKAGPESAAIATETLIKVNEELRKEISRLSEEVQKLREELRERGSL
jgi:formiminotetrahydrofolate cyclodeaminase